MEARVFPHVARLIFPSIFCVSPANESSDASAAFLHSSQLTTASGATAVFVIDVISVHVPTASCSFQGLNEQRLLFWGKRRVQSRHQDASCL